MAEELENNNSDSHVVILHQKFGKRPEDSYMIDIAMALVESKQKVTIFTSEIDDDGAFDNVESLRDSIVTTGTWIPQTVCGFLKRLCTVSKSLWFALQLLANPPVPKPKIVITDTDTTSLCLLRYLTNYKTLYVHHFPHLRCADAYYNNMIVVPDLLTLKTIGYADEIVLQTKALQAIFERSFPNVKKTKVLIPSYATGLWGEKSIDVRRIVPDLPTNYKLFVAFGDYKKRSNFMLILEALEEVIGYASKSFKDDIHVVLAGNYKNDCASYYNKLIEKSRGKSFASQVSFLKQLPTIHKKTLIEASIAVIHMVNYDLFPGPIIAAMSMGKPIIAVNNGFADTVLTHRISAILVEPEPRKLASVMYKIVNIATLQTFLGNMAKGLYMNDYSFKSFSDKIINLCNKYVQPEVLALEELM